jgi:branched-chain amino acid transport system ATP-binding protein
VEATLPTPRETAIGNRDGNESDELLRLTDIVATYRGGAIRALESVGLTVGRASIVALLGANGAGKTTVIRTVTGLLGMNGGRLNSGSIVFDGRRIESKSPSKRVALGLSQVMEGRRVFADLTVDENLQAGGFAVRDKRRRKESYERVLALFPALGDMRGRIAGYLSGGEQQMLAIGRALMQSPKLLLLDEPSLGLAPLMVQRIGATLREINATGTSILLVEQNTALALSISDYAYVLEHGRVARSGPSQELRQDTSIAALYLGGSASEEVSLTT